MTCDEARALFSPKADDRMTPEEGAELDGHLAVCPVCPREWQRFLETVKLLRSVDEPKAPPGFSDRVPRAARGEPSHRAWLRRIFFPLHVKLPLEVAAIVVVSVLVGLIYRQSSEPERASAPPSAAVATSPAPTAEPPAPAEVPGYERSQQAPPVSPQPASPSEPKAAAERSLARKEEGSTAQERGEGGRADSARDAGSSALARAPAPSAAAQAQFHIVGAFKPKNREVAGRQLEELAKEVGGTVVVERRGVVPGSYVELVLSRDGYPKLEAGLHQIGDLRIERRAENLPEQIQVSLRIQ